MKIEEVLNLIPEINEFMSVDEMKGRIELFEQ